MTTYEDTKRTYGRFVHVFFYVHLNLSVFKFDCNLFVNFVNNSFIPLSLKKRFKVLYTVNLFYERLYIDSKVSILHTYLPFPNLKSGILNCTKSN